jgi:hypothetical protein
MPRTNWQSTTDADKSNASWKCCRGSAIKCSFCRSLFLCCLWSERPLSQVGNTQRCNYHTIMRDRNWTEDFRISKLRSAIRSRGKVLFAFPSSILRVSESLVKTPAETQKSLPDASIIERLQTSQWLDTNLFRYDNTYSIPLKAPFDICNRPPGRKEQKDKNKYCLSILEVGEKIETDGKIVGQF